MGDLISREEAYKVLSEYYHHKTKTQHDALWDALSKVPPVEPKTGVWLKAGQSFVDSHQFRNFFCSICGHDLDEHIRTEPNYCPYCGAMMQR